MTIGSPPPAEAISPLDGRWKAPFFSIWSMQAFSLFGSQLVQFALIWWLTAETGSATVLAIAALFGLAPQIVLGPFIGALVDRWNRRLVMIGADALIALATVLIAVLFALERIEIWHVYALMFVRSLGGGFHWPAMSASTSLMVPKEHLSRIQGLNQVLQGALSIGSAPLGALLLEILPMQGILAIDVVTASMAIVPLLLIAIPQPKIESDTKENATRPSIWQDFKAGLRYAFGWPGLMMLILVAMLVNLVLSTAFTLLPILVTRHFAGSAIHLGWLEAVFGIGMISGGVLLGVWGGFKRRILTSFCGLMGMGLGALLLGVAPAGAFWLAIVAAFVIGVMQPITNGPVFAVLQAVVAPGMQGRIFTLLQAGATGMMPIGLLVAGPVADRFGVNVWFIAGGLATVLLGALSLFSPALRNIEDDQKAQVLPEEVSTSLVEAARLSDAPVGIEEG